MQNYIKYIIGVLIVGVVGFIVYPFIGIFNNQAPNVDTQKMAEVQSTELQVATNTASTTGQNKTESKINMNQDTYKVTLDTNKGKIVLELNHKIAPKTVENFVKLASSGFYDGVKFHRVIKDFMIQTGDPQSKDDKLADKWGTGGPGYKFADEITDPATYKTGYKRGILAMANSGPNTNGSQFFIMHKDVPLPPNYTIFGHVISGIETVDTIANVKTLYPGQLDRPAEPVVITKVSVE